MLRKELREWPHHPLKTGSIIGADQPAQKTPGLASASPGWDCHGFRPLGGSGLGGDFEVDQVAPVERGAVIRAEGVPFPVSPKSRQRSEGCLNGG